MHTAILLVPNPNTTTAGKWSAAWAWPNSITVPTTLYFPCLCLYLFLLFLVPRSGCQLTLSLAV